MDFVVWAASVGWVAVVISVDRVVNVQCYMVCVVKGGSVDFVGWAASEGWMAVDISVDMVIIVRCYVVCGV